MEHLQKYHDALTILLDEVTKELTDVAVHDIVTGDWSIRTDTIDQTETDTNTQADAAEEADGRVSILAELENRYRLACHAFKKIEQGSFGRCEISDEPIENKRLDANPSARTCIAHMDSEYTLPLP